MKYNGQNFNRIVQMHQRWLDNKPGNTPADFSGADLRGENFTNLDLRGAKFVSANLRGSTIQECVLAGADFTEALLDNVKFIKCVCTDTIFDSACMYQAEFHQTYLTRARIFDADMRRSKFNTCEASSVLFVGTTLLESVFENIQLIGASFHRANLERATILDANFADAEIKFANFDGVTGNFWIPMACPETGSFIGWKKCWGVEVINEYRKKQREYVVKLLIPEDAKRSSSTGRKCRCSKAKVLEIQDISGNVLDVDEVYSLRKSSNFVYKVGEIVTPDSFDENRWEECSHGIHFFMSRNEAVEYFI